MSKALTSHLASLSAGPRERISTGESGRREEKKKAGELRGTCPTWRMTTACHVANWVPELSLCTRELISRLLIGELRQNNTKHDDRSASSVLCPSQPVMIVEPAGLLLSSTDYLKWFVRIPPLSR